MELKDYNKRYIFFSYEDKFKGKCKTEDLQTVLSNICNSKEDLQKVILNSSYWIENRDGKVKLDKDAAVITLSENDMDIILDIINCIKLGDDE